MHFVIKRLNKFTFENSLIQNLNSLIKYGTFESPLNH